MSILEATARTRGGSSASTHGRQPRWRRPCFAWSGGNLSNAKGVGGGVFECRIDFGPGYRIYFGKDGDTLIVLLGGGTKARQQRDIENARHLWQEYRRRKPKGD